MVRKPSAVRKPRKVVLQSATQAEMIETYGFNAARTASGRLEGIFALMQSCRVNRTLSDYKGRDPLIHGGTCDGMVACLFELFETTTGTPADFRRAAKVLRKSAGPMKRQMKSPSLFRSLMVVAMQIARDQGLRDVR